MALKKCANCGVFFGGDGDTCSKCKSPGGVKAVITGDTEHDKFTNARALVYEQPHITPDELVKALKEMGIRITIAEIMTYVREGRFSLVTEGGGSYCLSCGKRIMIGSMCKECSDKLEVFRTPVKKVEKKEVKKPSGGMHTTKK